MTRLASDAAWRQPRSRSRCRSRSVPAPAPPRAAPTTTRTRTSRSRSGTAGARTARSRRSRQTIDAFEDANPNIHVKVVGNITDDKINQALRAGGSSAPDVVSSFTTDNVGQFCTSDVFADLTPFMEESGIDPAETFPPAQLEYTQYEGNQCALPLLSDAYGLYYNKDAFAAAGITEPPKTMSEFDADAVKLTKSDGDSYSQLGFMPNYHGYESTITHFAAQWSPTYFADDGKSNVAARPGLRAGHGVAEGAGRQARRLRQAREVPLHLR